MKEQNHSQYGAEFASKRKDGKDILAINWSIHVLNRSPAYVVQNMTPEEGWSGRKPYVDHFQTFGCIAYAQEKEEA